MSDDDMRRIVIGWNAFRPRWVEAYIQSIFEFAKFIKRNNIEIYLPHGILSSAGTLESEKEQLIKEVFGCEVYNRYGSREVGDMACSRGGKDNLELSIWNHLVEILTTDSKPVAVQEAGDVIVTMLNNYSMPFIRYRIGDLAVLGDNPQTLSRVQGRLGSLIKTNKGTFDSTALTTSFYYYSSIKNYQVVQKTKTHIIINVVTLDSEQWEKDKVALAEKLHKIFGDDVTLEFNLVDDIPPSASGKYQYYTSKIV